MLNLKGTTVFSIEKNLIVLDNDKVFDITFIPYDREPHGFIVSAEVIYSALVEYSEKHSLKASSTSFFISDDTSLK